MGGPGGTTSTGLGFVIQNDIVSGAMSFFFNTALQMQSLNIPSFYKGTFEMGNTKTEINLMRLLAASPHQQNQSKLIHVCLIYSDMPCLQYVATLREQLEELAEEKTPDGLPRVNDYSEKIEAIASKLAIPAVYSIGKLPFQLTMQESLKPFAVTSVEEGPSKTRGESPILTSPKLRRRFMTQSNIEDKAHNSVETHQSASVKLDAVEQIHIEKHRKLQDDLTDEMVGLAQQLKESSLMMNQSIKNTEKMYLIQQRRPLNIAWQALVVPVHVLWKYTRTVLRLHALHGL
ncbi:unnamed protein product [Camellia sinensis]